MLPDSDTMLRNINYLVKNGSSAMRATSYIGHYLAAQQAVSLANWYRYYNGGYSHCMLDRAEVARRYRNARRRYTYHANKMQAIRNAYSCANCGAWPGTANLKPLSDAYPEADARYYICREGCN